MKTEDCIGNIPVNSIPDCISDHYKFYSAFKEEISFAKEHNHKIDREKVFDIIRQTYQLKEEIRKFEMGILDLI